MSPRRSTLPAAIATAVVLTTAAASHAQLRIANYNVARLKGDTGALGNVLAALADDDKPGFATAPAALVLQEVRAQDVAVLSELVQASAPPGIAYALATYTTSPSEDASGGAAALFYRTDLLVESPSDHADLPTGAGRNADRWRLQLVGYDAPTAAIVVYGAHLKAGGTPSDEATRAAGVALLRSDAAALPPGTPVLFAGDLNLASSADDAYQAFIAPGPAQAVDPLGNGSWSGGANAIKHTQSPRDVTGGDLIGGGMDDRFDFQLVTAPLVDADGVALLPGTYRAVGNDGAHFNQAINTGSNFYYPGDLARSNALADALFDASDHVPLLAEYQVPAVMSAALDEDFGRVVQGADFGVQLLVANIADVVVTQGVDALEFAADGFGVVVGSGGDSVGALPDLATLALAVDTSAVGFVEGGVQATALSEAAQFSSWTLFTEGRIVRHANASFSPAVDQDVLGISWSVPQRLGTVALPVPIHNLGYDADQALLDVDTASGLGGRFGVSEPFPTSIAGDPGTLTITFDASGADPGTYSTTIVVGTSDEDIPGATTATLLLLASVEVVAAREPADLDGSGAVDGGDLGLLLAAWGACRSCQADLDGNGAVDGADLGILLSAWNG